MSIHERIVLVLRLMYSKINFFNKINVYSLIKSNLTTDCNECLADAIYDPLRYIMT